MTFFKKALLATAITAAASSAQAVTVASDTLKMSQEGVQIGNSAHEVAFGIDFVVEKTTPAASNIELAFGLDVDLSDLAAVIGTGEVKVWNDPAKGIGTITHNGTAPDDFSIEADQGTGEPLVTFFYGTGSFTFDRFQVVVGATTADKDSVNFDVNLGNPITPDSAFRMTFAGDTTSGLGWLPNEPVGHTAITDGASVDVYGTSDVCYTSRDLDTTTIEAECDDIAEEISQFAFDVTKEWDGIIERAVQQTFVDGYDTTPAADTAKDTVKMTVKNDQTLVAAVTGVTAGVVLEGNFDHRSLFNDDLVDANFTATVADDPAINGDLDEVSFALTAAEVGSAGAAMPVSVTFTQGQTNELIPVTGSVNAELLISTAQTSLVDWEYNDYAGQWMLDATIINVPYLPVGYEGTSSSIHFANEVGHDANVIATAIDNKNGAVYGPFDLGDLPAYTVTKFSQGFIMDEMGIPAERKVSITFNIDADNGDVTAYAFTSSSVGRTEISNSQQKGIKDGAM